jgi:regulator of sigma E protease
MFLTILLFILLLSLLVFVHEFGHFFIAKKSGMEVEEFGFGFPPRLFAIKKNGTDYSINWIPLGGFVRIKGETGDHAGEPGSFSSKGFWARFSVLIAGVSMNFLLAAVLFAIGFMVGLPTIVSDHLPESATIEGQSVQVMSVLENSPAAAAGLEAGDIIASLDDQVFTESEAARAYFAENADEGVATLVQHLDGTYETVTLTAEELESAGIYGVGLGLVTTGMISFAPHQAVVQGAWTTVLMTWEVCKAFGGLVRDMVVSQEVDVNLSGPVGIAVMTGEVAQMGFVYLLQFAAVLSINLGVINLFPFPALDGGRIIFLFIEKITRKQLNARMEAAVHNIGFIVLMALVVLVTYRDIVNFGG